MWWEEFEGRVKTVIWRQGQRTRRGQKERMHACKWSCMKHTYTHRIRTVGIDITNTNTPVMNRNIQHTHCIRMRCYIITSSCMNQHTHCIRMRCYILTSPCMNQHTYCIRNEVLHYYLILHEPAHTLHQNEVLHPYLILCDGPVGLQGFPPVQEYSVFKRRGPQGQAGHRSGNWDGERSKQYIIHHCNLAFLSKATYSWLH